MATPRKTLDRLQYLQGLYQQGYHSDVVDRSLDKLMSLEREAAAREWKELQGRLEIFEKRHGMSSVEFSRRFQAGELGDSADFVEWSVFYEMSVSVYERLERLAAEAA